MCLCNAEIEKDSKIYIRKSRNLYFVDVKEVNRNCKCETKKSKCKSKFKKTYLFIHWNGIDLVHFIHLYLNIT